MQKKKKKPVFSLLNRKKNDPERGSIRIESMATAPPSDAAAPKQEQPAVEDRQRFLLVRLFFCEARREGRRRRSEETTESERFDCFDDLLDLLSLSLPSLLPPLPKPQTQQDLEFLQLLSNPQFLSHLAQRRFLEDRAFLNYLKHLNYFRRPEYVGFVSYPDALEFLDLLTASSSPASSAFGKALARPDVAEAVREQQMWQWRGGGEAGAEAAAAETGAEAAAG